MSKKRNPLVGQDECVKAVEEGYYIWDAPKTRDILETPEMLKADVVIPQDVVAIDAKNEEERAALAEKDPQKPKEIEKHFSRYPKYMDALYGQEALQVKQQRQKTVRELNIEERKYREGL